MNRRSFVLKSSTMLGAGLAALTIAPKVFAQEAPLAEEPVCPPTPAAPRILNGISRNHGHNVVLSYEQVIRGEPLTISIQGTSGHAHNLVLGEEHFEALRKVSVIEVESSKDANHSHIVRITREAIP